MTTTQAPPRAPESHYRICRCSDCASDFDRVPVVGARTARFRRYEARLGTDPLMWAGRGLAMAVTVVALLVVPGGASAGGAVIRAPIG
jgi:hypothetical protein